MQMWRFLLPKAIGFTLKHFSQGLIDKLTGKPSRPLQTIPYVIEHAEHGNPVDVLRTLDQFARDVRWLMSVGPEKGPLIEDVRSQLGEAPRILELGAYCGYSSILISSLLGPEAHITSVEIDDDCVAAARSNVEVAGLSERVTVVHGASSAAIPGLQGPFDMVFLDHWKDLYLPDLKAMEEHGLLRQGSVVVADNVGEMFGAEAFLDYVRNSGKYRCENRVATIEYTRIPDAVEIAVYLPGEPAR